MTNKLMLATCGAAACLLVYATETVVDVPVDLYTAILGGEAVVHSKDGDYALKIPAGTQPDQLIRLSGKGMPKLNQKGARGDLFARIRVSLPRNLNTRQAELFKKLRDNE